MVVRAFQFGVYNVELVHRYKEAERARMGKKWWMLFAELSSSLETTSRNTSLLLFAAVTNVTRIPSSPVLLASVLVVLVTAEKQDE
jgi:hypothetical protein